MLTYFIRKIVHFYHFPLETIGQNCSQLLYPCSMYFGSIYDCIHVCNYVQLVKCRLKNVAFNFLGKVDIFDKKYISLFYSCIINPEPDPGSVIRLGQVLIDEFQKLKFQKLEFRKKKFQRFQKLQKFQKF